VAALYMGNPMRQTAADCLCALGGDKKNILARSLVDALCFTGKGLFCVCVYAHAYEIV